jgi:AAA+ ATPase superfamily predicted ATPase
MIIKWINPKIIIGNTATGDYYYDRPGIIADIWEQLTIGNHVLLAAPRRVGKSSIMKYMIEKSMDNYKCIYENIQGLTSADHFFQTIYELIKSCMNPSQKASEWLRLLKETGIEEVSITGTLKIRERTINYLEAVNHLLPKLKQNDFKIVLFIDELPEVLHNLNKNNKKEEAIIILKNLRRWRQEDQFRNFRLVLAGSIGIHYVIKTIEGRNVDVSPFLQAFWKQNNPV